MKNQRLKPILFLACLFLLLVTSQAACIASYTRTTPGFTVKFMNTSTTSGGDSTKVYYHWDFGDGTTSTLRNPIKMFTSAGVKNIQLTVYDSAINCSSSITDTIIVTPVSSNHCDAYYTASLSGLTVTFTNLSKVVPNIDPTNYYWNFGDGTTSTLKNPVKTYNIPGPKFVQLSIYDSITGCSTTSNSDSLMVQLPGSKCKASFYTFSSSLIVPFVNTSLNTDSGNTGLSYFWDFGDSTTSSDRNPTKYYTTSGWRIVKLFIKDSAQQCYSSATFRFFFNGPTPKCSAMFTATQNGTTLTFTNLSVNKTGKSIGLNYLWDFGDGTSSTLKNPVKTYNATGAKIIRLTIYDSIYSCSSVLVDTFYLLMGGNTCSANFTPNTDGLTVTFTNSSINANGTTTGLSYFWDFGDGTTSTLKNPVKTFASAGAKLITLTIFDSTISTGCSSSYSDTILLSSSTPLCSASFVLAADTTTPFHFFLLNTSIIRSTSTFFWDFGDGGTSTQMTPTHTYANFGKYYVCLTVSDTFCSSTFCDSIGMDSTGKLLKQGAFGFQTLDRTTLSTTGVTETGAALPDILGVYPNPATRALTIRYNILNPSTINFLLFDITGRELRNETVHSQLGDNTKLFDISELKPSIYFIKITTSSGQRILKFTKQ